MIGSPVGRRAALGAALALAIAALVACIHPNEPRPTATPRPTAAFKGLPTMTPRPPGTPTPVGRASPSRGMCPSGYPIKADRGPSRAPNPVYHVPGGEDYYSTSADECYDTEAAAQAAGYQKSPR